MAVANRASAIGPATTARLVSDEAATQFHYIPTVTREPFRTTGRIGDLIESAALFGDPVQGAKKLDPETDRIMLCGSMAMIRETAAMLDGMKLFSMGFSWGGYESLAVPSSLARNRTAVPWAAPGQMLRLHIGFEGFDDLKADLAAGLERYRAGLR